MKKRKYLIIVINPGSTSTKVAVYRDEQCVLQKSISHTAEELAGFPEIPDQLPFRKRTVLNLLEKNSIDPASADAFAAICTGLLPMEGGTFVVNDLMAEHARMALGSRHPGNLGPMLAKELADAAGVKGYVVDASSVDEFRPEARLTGFAGVLRTSRGHPLNQRAVAKKYAASIGRPYEELNLIVVHMGGGISVTAHDHGLMVDTVDSTRGEGRMAPTRSGGFPAAPLIELCFSGKYTKQQLLNGVQRIGGWTAHLGTSDAREVERRIAEGDRWAKLIYDTTVYQLGKDIGGCAAALSGRVDAILLTGGLAYSEYLTQNLRKRVEFIAPVEKFPGEMEMEALAHGALSVLRGKNPAKEYTGRPVFAGFEAWRTASGQ